MGRQGSDMTEQLIHTIQDHARLAEAQPGRARWEGCLQRLDPQEEARRLTSLVKELGMTEQLHFHFSFSTLKTLIHLSLMDSLFLGSFFFFFGLLLF